MDYQHKFDEKGREIPDPRPLAIPAGMSRPESLQDQIRRLIRVQMSTEAAEQGQETFDEANDFDIEDDDSLPYSPYEERELTPETPTQGKSNVERQPAESEDGSSENASEAAPNNPRARGTGADSGKPAKAGSKKPARGSGKAARPSQDGDSPDEDLDGE